MSGPILVVDDDTDSLGWVVEALESEGYRTVVATNGAEALRAFALSESPPCIVLLDMLMPVMSGWDVIASFVRNPAHPKVIVMSAHCRGGVPAGAVALLEKPLTTDEVVAAVRKWCGPPSGSMQAASPAG